MYLGSPNFANSPTTTLDNVIIQLQILTSSVANLTSTLIDLTQQLATTNSRVDHIVGQLEQLSNEVAPLLASAKSTSMVSSHTLEPMVDIPKFSAPNIPSKAPPNVICLPQAKDIIQDMESHGYAPLDPH